MSSLCKVHPNPIPGPFFTFPQNIHCLDYIAFLFDYYWSSTPLGFTHYEYIFFLSVLPLAGRTVFYPKERVNKH